MKNNKVTSLWAMGLSLAMAFSLTACGSKTKDETASNEQEVVSEEKDTEEVKDTVESGLDMTEEVSLNILGPGLFADIGEEDKVDLETGATTPGYHVVVERWNELYPNVTLNIEGIGWDNWQSVITTACLSGDVDVILHGASIVDITEDLTPYVEKTEGFAEQVGSYSMRHNKDDLSKVKVSGMPYTVNPNVVWLNVEKFENFGIELPDSDWTFEDVLTLAEQLTGTDPVTGENSYGLRPLGTGDSNLPINFNYVANALGIKVYDYKTDYSDTVVDYMESGAIDAFEIIAQMGEYMSPEEKEGLVSSIPFDENANWAIAFTPSFTNDIKTMRANGTEGNFKAINLPCAIAGDLKGLPVCFLGDNNIAMYKDSPNKDWAWEFIKFMSTDEVVAQWILDAGAIPNSLSAANRLTEMYGAESSEAIEFIKENIPKDFISTENQAYNTAYGTAVSSMTTAVSNLLNGYMTPEEAAEYMQQISDEYKASLGSE